MSLDECKNYAKREGYTFNGKYQQKEILMEDVYQVIIYQLVVQKIQKMEIQKYIIIIDLNTLMKIVFAKKGIEENVKIKV